MHSLSINENFLLQGNISSERLLAKVCFNFGLRYNDSTAWNLGVVKDINLVIIYAPFTQASFVTQLAAIFVALWVATSKLRV